MAPRAGSVRTTPWLWFVAVASCAGAASSAGAWRPDGRSSLQALVGQRTNTYEDDRGRAHLVVRRWPQPTKVYVQLEGFGTVGAARHITSMLDEVLTPLDRRQDHAVEVLVNMEHSTNCAPRSLPVIIGFLHRQGHRFKRVHLVGRSAAMEAARACIYLGRLSRFRVFPSVKALFDAREVDDFEVGALGAARAGNEGRPRLGRSAVRR